MTGAGGARRGPAERVRNRWGRRRGTAEQRAALHGVLPRGPVSWGVAAVSRPAAPRPARVPFPTLLGPDGPSPRLGSRSLGTLPPPGSARSPAPKPAVPGRGRAAGPAPRPVGSPTASVPRSSPRRPPAFGARVMCSQRNRASLGAAGRTKAPTLSPLQELLL